MKFRNAKDIKYYLYISTAKMDMLYEQISDTAKKSQKKTVAGNAFGISASYESSTEEIVDRDDKIKAIEAELTTKQLIGTPETPKDYFKGIMRMRWGLFNDCETRPKDEPTLVFFGGFEKATPLVVGLGGSSKHVLGHEGATSTWSRSCTPTIVKWIVEGLKYEGTPKIPAWWDKQSEESELFSGVAVALHNLRPPTQELEFLAKTLAVGTTHNKHLTGVSEAKVVLGTPLYVVLSNPMPDDSKYGLDKDW